MTSPTFPEPPQPIPPTPLADVDAIVTRMSAQKSAWSATSIEKRIDYLKKCMAGVLAVAEEWVKGGCRLKGIDENDSLAGEEWLAGPWQTARNIRLLIEALEKGGQPKPKSIKKRDDGRKVARVFPQSIFDRLLFTGFSGEIWFGANADVTQGSIYRDAKSGAPKEAKVALVLGAGNVSSIAPMDALYKLFAENEIPILKMNPVNAHVGPRIEEAFRSLIDDGFFAVVYGGAEVGSHLANHPLIETLHVTGSDKTYDAIVWGTDKEEQKRRKAENDRINTRQFSAELGCVTPVIVVPGPWSESDLEFQARHVAAMVAQNASFNCNAAKVLVTSSSWIQRKTFLAKVHEALKATRARKAYYPGAQDRYKRFIDRYPQAQVLGEEVEGAIPWTAIPDVPAKANEFALNEEAFCGVLAEVTLDAEDEADFFAKSVAFANDECWGTLSCGLLVHPATMERFDKELDRAIADLRYGGIAINAWPGVVYALVTTTWGAYPGHPPTDIQSGSGVVHNALLFDHPQKSVIFAPFRIRPKPVWFADHKNLAEVGKRLLKFEANPSWGTMISVAGAALKG